MNKTTVRKLAAALTAVLLFCSGCSMDVDQFLRPPKTRGEQQAVQTALETYLRDSGQSDVRYTLCYPVEGEHTAAFVLCDAAGKPLKDTGETASLAVAFYSLPSAPNDTHINLLRREGDEWISVADTVGASADILQAAFGDLDGDGMAELLAGWDTYNSRDHRLTILSLARGLTLISDDRVYNRLFIGDMTATGRDSLVRLRMTGDAVTATLEEVRGDQLVSLGRVMLDSEIQQFNKMMLCRLTDGVHGLFVDAVKGTDTAVTELIYYDKDGLHAPFCHQSGRVNTVTARPVGLAMWDVDGDSIVEIPQCTLLPQYTVGENVAEYAYRTEWMVWDIATGEWQAKMHTIVNADDGYLVRFDDRQIEMVTTVYDSQNRILTVTDTNTDMPLLRLRPLSDKSSDDYTMLFTATDRFDGCEAWFDETVFSIDTVRYMVLQLN